MNFYASLIFLGIIVVIVALVGVAYDRKKGYNHAKSIDYKKEQLTEIINDAEQMIEELNKFSDYVVTQMDLKNEEMSASLKQVEERFAKAQEKFKESIETNAIPEAKVVNGNTASVPAPGYTVPIVKDEPAEDRLELSSEGQQLVQGGRTKLQGSKQANKIKNNVIPINNKYMEVIRLSEEGFSDIEIAKKLNMGKGEVQLVLDMNK
ncbi:MAG: hypothetical protein Q8920_10750 [Bacillota bacterium]|nr:hypothetical protein [Bacillota bacterium]